MRSRIERALIPHTPACMQPPKSLAAYKGAEQKMVRAADYALKH